VRQPRRPLPPGTSYLAISIVTVLAVVEPLYLAEQLERVMSLLSQSRHLYSIDLYTSE
jgi:hypothetical protein